MSKHGRPAGRMPESVADRQLMEGVYMARRIRITAIRKEKPDVGLYVLALIALARQLQDEERAKTAEARDAREVADGQ